MSENEDLVKGIDAVIVALGDISKRLKEMPEQVEKTGFPCPACGEAFQSEITRATHVFHKHRDWVVFRDPREVLEEDVERALPVERFQHELVPQELERPARKGLVGWLRSKPRGVERDWGKVAVGAIVIVVVLLLAAAFLL